MPGVLSNFSMEILIRKYLIGSLAMHLLLLGTAIAFARYGNALLPAGPEAAVTVLLLSEEEQGGNTYPEKTVKQAAVNTGRRDVLSPDGKKNEYSREISNDHGRETESAVDEERPSQTGPGSSPASDLDNLAEEDSAPLSPQQWAVIFSSLERAKNYPRLARERGIEGTVHLRFRMKPHGEIEEVEVVKSSGYDILDSASIKTIYRAGPMPYVSGWVEVPLAYILK